MVSPERVLADESDLDFFPIGKRSRGRRSGRVVRGTLVDGERRLGRRRPRLLLRPRRCRAEIGGATVGVKIMVVDLVRREH